MAAFARSSFRKLAASLALAALVLPSIAAAQSAPGGALPSYARPAPVHETITGTVSSFDGKYALLLNDDRGFVDSVQLREGTIINPTGLRLIEGMRLTIAGYTAGKTFVALQIDTPYTITSGVPVAPAPAYGYGYGYSGYGSGYPGYGYYGGYYPWYYPVAAFGLGVAFGSIWPYYGGYYGYRGYYGGYYGYRGGYYGYGYGGYHGYGWGGYRNPAYPGGYRGGYGGAYGGGYRGGYAGYGGGYHGGSYGGGYHGGGYGGGYHGGSYGGHR